MREIKFRGKAKMSIEELNELGIKHENGWVIGNLIQNDGRPYIVGDLVEVSDEYLVHEWWVSVIPESIGQYTTIKLPGYGNDYPPVELYEGDVILNVITNKSYYIHFEEGSGVFLFVEIGAIGSYTQLDLEDELYSVAWVVLGNIFDMPKLLEGTA